MHTRTSNVQGISEASIYTVECMFVVMQNLRYELNDCAFWEFVFPSNSHMSSAVITPPTAGSVTGQHVADDDNHVTASDFDVGLSLVQYTITSVVLLNPTLCSSVL